MNDKIDVLAVLDRAAVTVIDLSPADANSPNARELRQARAAIAELIEATKDFVEVRTHNGPRMHYGPVESERLHAALARVNQA